MATDFKPAKPTRSARRGSTSRARPRDRGTGAIERQFSGRSNDYLQGLATGMLSSLARIRNQSMRSVTDAFGDTRGDMRQNQLAYSRARNQIRAGDNARLDQSIDDQQADLALPGGGGLDAARGFVGYPIPQDPNVAPDVMGAQNTQRLRNRQRASNVEGRRLDRQQNRDDRSAARDIRQSGRGDVASTYAGAMADMLVEQVLGDLEASRMGGGGGGGYGYGGGGGYGGYSYGGGYSSGGWDPMGEFYSEPMSDTQLQELFRGLNLNDDNADLLHQLPPRQALELSEIATEAAELNPAPYNVGGSVSAAYTLANQRYGPRIERRQDEVLDVEDLVNEYGNLALVPDEVYDENQRNENQLERLQRRLAQALANIQGYYATPYNTAANYNQLAVTAGRRPVVPIPQPIGPSPYQVPAQGASGGYPIPNGSSGGGGGDTGAALRYLAALRNRVQAQSSYDQALANRYRS